MTNEIFFLAFLAYLLYGDHGDTDRGTCMVQSDINYKRCRCHYISLSVDKLRYLYKS